MATKTEPPTVAVISLFAEALPSSWRNPAVALKTSTVANRPPLARLCRRPFAASAHARSWPRVTRAVAGDVVALALAVDVAVEVSVDAAVVVGVEGRESVAVVVSVEDGELDADVVAVVVAVPESVVVAVDEALVVLEDVAEEVGVVLPELDALEVTVVEAVLQSHRLNVPCV